jgi:S1-C subfamily serine protease
VDTVFNRTKVKDLEIISSVIQETMPSVVYIAVTLVDHPIHTPPHSPRTDYALGSGAVISSEGYIVTCAHVVKGASKIEVMFSDWYQTEATLIGADYLTDIAIIKIDPFPEMQWLEFADSDDCDVGDFVFTIGHPHGFDWSVTFGIISGVHRMNTGFMPENGYEDFIQTDAAINSGNSGGPLINIYGEIIGINSLIYRAGGNTEGMGFAVSSNLAKFVCDSFIKYGVVRRGIIGIIGQTIRPSITEELNLPSRFRGVLIQEVSPGGPADQAGLTKDDILISYEGKLLYSISQLRLYVAGTFPGTEVVLEILRNEKIEKIKVIIGELK